MDKNIENLDQWRMDLLENLSTESAISLEEVEVLVWFFYHSYADFANSQLQLTGFSLREKAGDWLLVLKVLEDDLPRVVFVGSSTPTRCMQKARKLLRGPGLTVYEDKFA